MNTRPFCAGISCFLLVLAGGRAVAADEPPAPAPEVPVAHPVSREVADYEDFSGRTEARLQVEMRARVTGYLLKTAFQDGAEVKEGDVLFEIDARLYRAELDKAEAAVHVAEARLKLAETNRKRAAAGLARRAVSQEELDKAIAELAETEAGVHLAKANRDLARLNLEFTRVAAPVSGQIGRRLVDPGNLVKADDTLLAVIVSRDPMYAYFDIDEGTLLRLRQAMREGKLKAEKLPAAIGLAGEKGFPHQGVVDFVDNRVDPETGTLRLRAVLPNQAKLLSPGMSVRVRLPMGEPYKVLLIPEEAVMTEDGARFVFVVTDKDEIAKRRVVLGRKHGDSRAVTDGLKADERVVTGRLHALQPGMAVRARESDVPGPKPGSSPESAGPPALGSARGATGPGILVEAVYPGADARIVAETVRSPIEQQVSSLENIRYMRSRCTNDGTYALAVTFARGVDLKTTQLLVQNRVALATPALPEEVRTGGAHVKQGTSGVLLIVNLSSPNNTYDSQYLSNYANIQIRDELARLSGVGEVAVLGGSDYGLRVSLDPERLAARNLSAGEVARLIDKQKETGGFDLDTCADLILKADNAGRAVRLRDVAKVELGPLLKESRALLDGKPVAALVIHPTGEARPQQVRDALRERLAEIRARFPQDLDLDVAFDFTANLKAPDQPANPEYLLLDVDLPITAAAERAEQVLAHCEALVRQLPGVQHALALSENPFDLFGRGPCVVVRLAPKEQRASSREDVIKTIRARLNDVTEMTLRLRDLSGPGRFPRCGYPVDLALYGSEVDRVREWAKNLGARLGQSKKLTDVLVNSDSAPRPHLFLDVDRTRAATLGVPMNDVFNTLQVYMGGYSLNDLHRFGRTWRVHIRAGDGSGDQAKDISKLKVRNARGRMIPLGTLVTVRETEGAHALDFLDLWPMVEITGNPAFGVSGDQARKLCETLAEEARKEFRLPAEYRLAWLR